MKKILIGLGLVLIACPIVAASFTRINTSGVDLLKGTKFIIKASQGEKLHTDDALIGSYYSGYMRAFNDLSFILATEPPYCLPEQGISEEQIAYIVESFLESKPDKLHVHDGTLLYFALAESFPCKD